MSTCKTCFGAAAAINQGQMAFNCSTRGTVLSRVDLVCRQATLLRERSSKKASELSGLPIMPRLFWILRCGHPAAMIPHSAPARVPMNRARTITAAKFIKLGTAVRFLIDAKPGTALHDRRVIPNIDTVFTLLDELDFPKTKDSAPFKHLKVIRDDLLIASASNPNLTAKQAVDLEAESRRIRDELLIEGASLELGRIDPATSQIEVKFRFRDIGKLEVKVIVSAAMFLATLIFGAFSAGVKASQIPWLRDLYEVEWKSIPAAATPTSRPPPSTPVPSDTVA